jgi:transcriptional regulator with GAF, ATPase, and Fis domain
MDSLKDKISEIERQEIINALKECNWVMAKAAKKLGITERRISYKIKKYGIRKEEDKTEERRQKTENRRKE